MSNENINIVYKTTNLINNKIYIGIHKQKGYEFDGYFGSGKILQNAINTHGVENFIRETLFIYDTYEECRLKEKEIVNEEFCKNRNTYNISVGGQGGNTSAGMDEDRKREISKKLSRSLKKAFENISDDRRAIYAKRMKKIRIQPDNKGRKHTKYSIKNMTENNHMKNKKWYTNGIDNLALKNNEEIPYGYYEGRYIPYENKFNGHSKETLNNMSQKRKGGEYYNNGLINIYIHNNEEIPYGFIKGMKSRNSSEKYTWYTNGTDNLGLYENDPIPEGFIKGRTFKHNNTKVNAKYYFDGEKSVICKGDSEIIPEGYELCQRIFYTNGIKNLLLPKGYKYIPDGFVIGKSKKKNKEK